MREHSVGIESVEVELLDGFKTKISHCLKNGIGQMYWYTIQMQCKGWMQFDIRSFTENVPADCILTPKSLPFVADFVKQHTISQMKNISYPLF